MSEYFKTIDSEIKAYLLGIVVFNITKVKDNELTVDITDITDVIAHELKQISDDDMQSSTFFTIKDQDVISSICKHLDADDLNNFYNINIETFIKNNKREHVIEFLKAFYEKHSNIYFDDVVVCHITTTNKNNLIAFADFFGIPHSFDNLFNLVQLSYKNVNIVDILGIIYKNAKIRVKDKAYSDFLLLLNNERPTLKYIKMSNKAVTPTKANFSDVGYDISIIGLCKTLNSNTSLFKTDLKLDIPVGYYVELVPRSSLSKSGYMLANSIGIIDCSYKGELLVALTKINDSYELEYPFRCCQLVMRKQIYPDMVEVTDCGNSSRSEGGFGSTS